MPNKYLDSVGLAEYTSLIKAELAPKNSPALTGTPTAPTPTAGDDSTQIATTEFVQDEVASKYLPLAGGTMTGNIKFGSGYISKSTDTAALNLNGGSGSDSGAYLNLYGKSHASSAGAFSLSAYDGTTRKQLVGLVNGKLTWAGNDVALSNNVLALSGGTMTGNIVANKQFFEMTNSTLNGRNSIYGGTSGSTGAFLYVYGKDHSNLAGNFVLHANDGTTTSELVGKPDGTLTWNGQAVITSAGGTMSAVLNMDNHALNLGASSNDDGRIYNISNTLRLTGGSNTSTGSYIDIGSASAGTKGIKLVASDGNTTKELTALYNGTLTWGGLDISPQTWATATFADKSVATGTRTNLGSFTLTKGTWLLCIAVNFPSNASGYRDINISNSSAGSQLDRYRFYRCAPTNGSDTHIIWTVLDSVSANTTRYVNVMQNSGSALTVGGGYIAFRLSNAA